MSKPEGASRTFPCALCGGPLTVLDNINSGLISVNVDGHARAAHRVCPTPKGEQS
jgi:hypothetical protein